MIIASLVLINILSAASILGVGNSYAIARLIIEVDGFLITGI
jgi:hypothetical protein